MALALRVSQRRLADRHPGNYDVIQFTGLPKRGSLFRHAANPAHRGGRLLIYLTHALDYVAYRRKLARSLYGRIIPKNAPFFDRKFAAPYLATFLTPSQRLSIQSYLCDLIGGDFGPAEWAGGLADGLELWRSVCPEGEQSLVLRLPVRTMLEGDLTLEHVFNGELLHRLSFALAPGAILGLPDRLVAFIGGSQGAHSSAQSTRQAARVNGEINAANMTMIALRALCQTLGITTVCGVNADHQPVVADSPERHLTTYDLFWQSQRGEAHQGFYVMPANLTYNDDDEVGAANRSRARRKRRLRMMLTDQIRDNILQQRFGDIVLPMAAE